MTDNVIELKQPTLETVDLDIEPTYVKISKSRLYRMENESRLLSIMLEHGVEGWDQYPMVLSEYRADPTED